MAAYVLPALCAIIAVHVVFGVVIAAARYQRANALRDSGTEVL